MRLSSTISLALMVSATAWAAEPLGPFATYRGNPERTGNADGKAGPAAPKVLWVFKAKEHFVASPVPVGDAVIVAGLGGFNVPILSCLPLAPMGEPTARWTKTTPSLKLPTVSSPAVAGGRLVFGDGMHQTDGAALYCLGADGKPLWQLPVPGEIKDNPVHLEGAPAFVGGKVYAAGGGAGVICIDADRVSLDGKELDPAAVRKVLDAKWKELQEKYKEDRKKDPDFAVPPSDDQLPKPTPRVVWQEGKGKWHVDAPVNVAGDAVLVASSFLEKEHTGDRALHCLDAATGKPRWRVPLPLNPWGGASVSGETVVVTGSSVGYYLKEIKGAKGDVSAFDLKTGKPKWRKEVKGGVVGCAAIADNLVVCTATDGRVRAYDLATGEPRWTYDAKAPLFAAPAVAGGVAYAGDLLGVVHAIGLKDGRELWRLDLGKDPAVKAPGMIYGGPVVHGGKVIVATCNLEGPSANQPTVVVCIGTK